MNSNRRIRFKLVLLLGLFLSVFVTFGNVKSAMAGQVSTIYESVNKKGRYQGVYNCYQATKDGKYVIDGKIELSEYAGMVSLFYRPLGVDTAGPGAKVKMPLAKRETINCEALLNKYKSKAPASSSGKDKIEEFLTNMGYSMNSDAQSGNCYYLSFKYNGKKKTSNRVCQENGRTWTGGDPKYQHAGFWWQNGEASGVICLTMLNGKGESQINNSRCINLKGSEENSKLSAKKIINKLVSDYNICSGGKCTREKIDNKITNLETKGPEAASNGVVAKLTKAKRPKGGEKAIATLSGNKETKKSVAIGSLEKRLLYQAYLHSYYGTTISCKSGDYMDGEIQWYKWANGEKKTQKCWYNKNEHNANVSANKKVHAVNKDGWFEGEIGIDDLIKKLQKSGSYSDSEVKEMQELLKNGGVTDETDNNNNGDPCLSEGKGFGLNWIICRVIDLASTAANNAYNGVVEPFLSIKSTDLFDGKGKDGVTQAWEQFRDFANIVFVIILLVVIFSQLTGVGITNYGIKKILPKLIVLAIMINLSYFLCVLAVDLSNILGNGFQALLQNMSDNLNINEFVYDGKDLGKNIAAVGGGLAGLGLLTGVITTSVVFADAAMILSLLVTAVGVAISIFFLFILLSVRQAAIVVLVVISPLAVVMYALPNTKKLFDRWLKLFEGLLLVYPIAGLLVGAGDFVSRLMVVAGLATGFGIFVAIIVSVAPIFFIPTVLKQSFAAMGSMGSKLAGFGQTLSGNATKGIRDSGRYKDLQDLAMERKARKLAGIDRNGDALKVGKIGTLLRGGKRNMARARSQYLKNQDARDRENSLMDVGYEAAAITQRKKMEADEVSNYATLINDKTRNGEDEDTLFTMYNDYMKEGNKFGAAAVARVAGRRKDTAERFSRQVIESGSTYSPEMMQAVSKEMATGENNGMYRQGDPLAFEFAAQLNRGTAGTQDYDTWLGMSGKDGKSNISRAMDNYVTNSQELVGMKGHSLDKISELISKGEMDSDTAARIKNLATQTIENRDKPGAAWDSTKAKQLAEISGEYKYDKATDTLTKIS